MQRPLVKPLFAATLITAVLVIAGPAYGKTLELYTVQGFVDELIERGIIPADMATKARTLAALVSDISVEDATKAEEPSRYADSVTVRASQLIAHASRTYEAGAAIEGLVLLVENTSETDVWPTAVRKCQVVYTIFDDTKELYDSSTRDGCDTDETVSYRLEAGSTRMFEIRHNPTSYTLLPGEYVFHLEYPGYGEDSLTVTVTD